MTLATWLSLAGAAQADPPPVHAPLSPISAGSRTFYPYAFDGHVHTAYSYDADHPPLVVLQSAERAGLDALIVTDHGTHIAQRDFHAYDGKLTVFPGQEVGGPFGHAVMWNVAARQNVVPSETPLKVRAAFAHAHGGLLVFCHPGWWIDRHQKNPMDWLQPETLRSGDSADIDAIELWNGVYERPLRALIEAWLNALDAGVYKPIVGGSDFHRLGAHRLGGPRTVALCPTAEPKTCLWDAVRKGNAYVTDGPAAALRVDDAIMGEELAVQPGQRLSVQVSVYAPAGGELRVYLSHDLVRSRMLTPRTTLEETFVLEAPAQNAYVRIEVVRTQQRGLQHNVQLLSNPVRLRVVGASPTATP